MLTKEEYSRLHTQLCLRCLAFNQVTEIIERFVEKPKREIQVGDIYLNDFGQICRVTRICMADEMNAAVKIEKPESGTYLSSGKTNAFYTRALILDKRYKLVEITDGE